jgi:hypothetical protein
MRRLRLAMAMAMAGTRLGGNSALARTSGGYLACAAPTAAAWADAGRPFQRAPLTDEQLAAAAVPADFEVTAFETAIPVYVHVIEGALGAGNVSDARIAAQIEVLNSSFGPWGFTFFLADTDHTFNATWFDGLRNGSRVEKAVKTALRRGSADDLNIYTANGGDFLLGYSSFPWDYAKSPIDDGVVMLHSTLPGGTAAPYNEGDQTVQMVGHWLGLLNTFEGGCAKKGGDLVDDTPAEKSPTFDCQEGRDTCRLPGLDSVRNFMNWGEDGCMDSFTPGQAARMDAQWTIYRFGK